MRTRWLLALLLLLASCGRAVSVGQVPGDPVLTLVKQVVNANGGTATVANWTLQAFGPVNLAGPGGSPQVTNQTVPVGTYQLREASNSTTGYVPGVWSCTGASSFTTNSVTLATGDVATCSITNSDTNVVTTTTQIEATTTTSATTSTTMITTTSTPLPSTSAPAFSTTTTVSAATTTPPAEPVNPGSGLPPVR